MSWRVFMDLFTNFDERISPFSPTLTIRVLTRTKMTIPRTTRGSYQSVSEKKRNHSRLVYKLRLIFSSST